MLQNNTEINPHEMQKLYFCHRLTSLSFKVLQTWFRGIFSLPQLLH